MKIRLLVALVAGTIVGVLAAAWQAGPAAAENQSLPAGWVATASGPLSPADRDLIVRVRLAGLWEAPTGQQAQQRASSAAVKHVGEHLAAEHLDLDGRVRAVAAELGIDLPSQPSSEQQGWMAELSTKSGEEYDRTFVARLRAAHGKVFSVVSAVRASTRNDTIRAFAQTAVEEVLRHMTYLESPGLVDFSALPPPPAPASIVGSRPAPAVLAAKRSRGGVGLPIVWIVLAAAAVAGAVVTARVIRPR